jgi:membrane-associated phospholipid phosphatase
MNPVGLALAGMLLVGLGAGHRLQAVEAIDLRTGLTLQRRLKPRPWIDLFRLLWPLGRSEFTMLALVGLAFYNLGLGACAAGAFVAWMVIDRLVKRGFKRVRPYERQPGTAMLQPRRPGDPSFPSGDAYHAWFLALTAIQVFHLPVLAALAVGLLAALVSLGRIVMGVHYPLDVIAGTGIGLIAAASEFLFLFYFHPV